MGISSKKERDEKREYERLLNNINKREKKIISDQEKIETQIRTEEMKIKRTKVSYHGQIPQRTDPNLLNIHQ